MTLPQPTYFRLWRYFALDTAFEMLYAHSAGVSAPSVPTMKKIYTCTPVSFHANETFWIRDTGLICRSLGQLGIESKCIMLNPAHTDDIETSHIIRADFKDLICVSWWKNLQLDGLVLYSWGKPQFLLIARAIRKAGIPFSIHWDGGGDLLPNYRGNIFKRGAVWLKFYISDYLRARHLSYANAITIAPTVRDFFAARAVFGGAAFTSKCVASTCPVNSTFRYEGGEKEKLIIAIGRWDDEKQKRTTFMMQTLEYLYRDYGWGGQTEIYGTITPRMQTWHSNLPEELRLKIVLKGYIRNARLKEVYNRARIIFCSSSHEGSHNVSAESLCCGCSVVTTNRPKELSVLHWYTSQQSGRIAEEDTPISLAQALSAEDQAWENGERRPQDIAAYWQPYFHADKVYSEIFGLK